MTPAVSKWVYFSVIRALLPGAWFGVRLAVLQKPIGLETLFGKGELLLAASAFVAAGLGELIASGRRYQQEKLRVGGCCVVILCFGVNGYADVSTWLSEGQKYSHMTIALFTVCWCIFSIAVGAACIILGQRR